MKGKLLIFLILAFLLASCGPTEQDTAATIEAAVAATRAAIPTWTASPTIPGTATPTATFTLTPTPTNTFTPTPTESPTVTPSPTATPIPKGVVVVQFAEVYKGIATYAPIIAGFSEGTTLTVVSTNPDHDWYLVEIAPNQTGWIYESSIELTQTDLELAIVDPPIPPTLTPKPERTPSIFTAENGPKENASVHLSVNNFQPKENIFITVTLNGNIVSERQYQVNPNGFIMGYLGKTHDYEKGETYIITAEGDQGSYAQTTYTREN